MDLSVVVPVRNEVENVEPLLREIIAALHGRLDFEVVFVDDGSDDGTAQLLSRLKSEIKLLRLVRHSRSCGQSTAVHTGVNVAQGAWIATLDGDGQNDPADIPKLLQQRHESTDPGLQMVCGFRAKRQDTWLRRLSSRVANGVRSRLLNDASIDTGCGLKLFRRDAFLHLPYFDHMHRFFAGASATPRWPHRVGRSASSSAFAWSIQIWLVRPVVGRHCRYVGRDVVATPG